MAKLELEVKTTVTIWFYIAKCLAFLNLKSVMNIMLDKQLFDIAVNGNKMNKTYTLRDFFKHNPDLAQ